MKVATLLENNLLGALSSVGAAIALLFITGDWAQDDGWLSVGALVSLMVAGLFAALGARAALLGVRFDAEGFQIRNLFRSHLLRRSDVVTFERRQSNLLRNPIVVALLRDGKCVRVSALGPSPLGLFNQQRRLERALAGLNEHCSRDLVPPPEP